MTREYEDAISRQAVLKAIKNLYPGIPVVDINGARLKWLRKYKPYFECEKVVEQLPSITPQPKIGHWIMTGDYHASAFGNIEYVKCSCCREYSLEEGNYCSNCGAKMQEDEGK